MDLVPHIEEKVARSISQRMPNFECHVTLDMREVTQVVEEVAKAHGFKTSLLVGDEELGPAKHLYCTSHSSDFINIHNRMEALIHSLTLNSLPLKRKKIELIVLDERF